MRKSFLLLASLIMLACTQKDTTRAEMVSSFFEGLNDNDYNKIKKTISDSLTIIEGDYIMSFSKNSYYRHFQWDSVFKPEYNIISLDTLKETIVTTVAKRSSKFKFLKNNPLTTKQKFYFKSGKINKIEHLEFIGVSWERWETQKDTLVNWIKIKHPELDGFIHDLSLNGALNYLKAIKLFNNRDDFILN